MIYLLLAVKGNWTRIDRGLYQWILKNPRNAYCEGVKVAAVPRELMK